MTREEYIDFANALKNNYTIDFDKLPEFCDMAISALSENKGDLISRESVLARVRLNFTTHQTVERHEIEDIIKSEPSAENKGKWIEKEVSLDGDIAYECSECGGLFCLIDRTPADNLYNFCPNCGADMRL